MKISRQAYADMFGPTVGDKVRLADTDLWIEVEKDYTHYGEEVKFGGGKVIREITETTGAKIDIGEDGTINIFATTGEAGEAAKKWIEGITATPEINKIYDGKVVRIVDFGAFVNFLGGLDGLVHISEMADHRVNVVTDVVNEGDTVKDKVLEIDGRGKVRLSMKVVDQATGDDLSDQYEMAGKSMRRKRQGGEAQEA